MSIREAAGRTFSALENRNYRRFYTGQAISLIGTWMQTTAQAWLVLQLTHSAAALGIVIGLQTVPVLLLGPYGGVIADRVDKRRLMIALQSAMGVQALILALLTITHMVNFVEVCILAVILGLNNCFENPARQAFVLEMVGRDKLRNAVSLNSTLINAARAVGPGIAGLLIATVGEGWCFILNSLSFVAVVTALTMMDTSTLKPSKPAVRQKGQLREGFAYVARTPEIGIPLLMMGLVGMLAYEFSVTLPVMAERVFHGGAETFGIMTSMMGVGAIAGGLLVAARGKTGLRSLVIAATMFGAFILAAAVAPLLGLEFVALALVGYTSVSLLSMGNSTLQLRADPEMRGRVMALWAVAFMGTTPIGGPIIGWITAVAGARVGLGVGGMACLVAAGIGFIALKRLRPAKPEHGFGPVLMAEQPVVSQPVAVPVTAAASRS